jgi:tetratricopeptide (TPR) repeat protein
MGIEGGSVDIARAQDRERCESVIADLIAEASTSSDVATRADCLREAAAIYETQLGDPLRALLAWQAAFAEDPASEAAGLAVERLAVALSQWSVVLPECEALLADSDAPARAAILGWLGRWAEHFARDDSAAERYLAEAHELAPASLEVADALSALFRKQGDWSRAAEVCRHAGQTTTDVEAGVSLLLEAARIIHTRVGDVEGAMQLYRRVLELDPRNAAAAEALAEAAGASLEPAAICARYRQALEVDPDNVGVMRQWADVAFTHGRWDDVRFILGELFGRVGPGVRPDSRARLNEALDRFVAAQKWPEAVDVLRTLARESTGALAAKYFLAAGKIAQHELNDHQIALELYERGFDAEPDEGKIAERIFAMLSSTRSWAEAETSLRKLIARVRAAGKAEDARLILPLWRRLGDVYRTGLKDMVQAAAAYKECARLAPQDRYAKMVAELTARSPVLAALDAGAARRA